MTQVFYMKKSPEVSNCCTCEAQALAGKPEMMQGAKASWSLFWQVNVQMVLQHRQDGKVY